VGEWVCYPAVFRWVHRAIIPEGTYCEATSLRSLPPSMAARPNITKVHGIFLFIYLAQYPKRQVCFYSLFQAVVALSWLPNSPHSPIFHLTPQPPTGTSTKYLCSCRLRRLRQHANPCRSSLCDRDLSGPRLQIATASTVQTRCIHPANQAPPFTSTVRFRNRFTYLHSHSCSFRPATPSWVEVVAVGGNAKQGAKARYRHLLTMHCDSWRGVWQGRRKICIGHHQTEHLDSSNLMMRWCM